ncbi:tetratricopeptide repeat protein [Streptomyces sp. 549]|uniref:tetratricopeptide repeat protein n=1 Tax=Streptomyces sp. 549 TaxID=3049076 RepID=UPI0024C2C494|nr:tetratricopeptide repeat protein [Streptomyces sp. 549]MDK1472596.1 tetratricopeptide repeat protein [Streptomyces sp. 549]
MPQEKVEGRADPQVAVSDYGRLFQAARDQHITEHHHHYPEGSPVLLPGQAVREPYMGPDSVRVPVAAPKPVEVRDRVEYKALLTAAVRTLSGKRVHVLHGMGGCGKTTLARHVFDECTATREIDGFWVNAAHRTSLRAGMLAVAADRGATAAELEAVQRGHRPAADLVWHHLDGPDRPWLLVLDNADDPACLDGGWLRSSCHGTVLVTTRQSHSALWSHAETHRVDLLDPEDAALVLRDLAPSTGSDTEALLLAQAVGCLPLALTLAGSQLSQQILEPMTMDELRRRMADNPSTRIDQGVVPWENEPRRALSSTWQLSLDGLAERGLPAATTLMRLLSCFASDPLPVGVIPPRAVASSGLGDVDPPLAETTIAPCLKALVDHSLVAVDELHEQSGPPLRLLRVHGLVLDTVWTSTPEAQRPILLAAAAALLSQALPEPAGATPAGDRMRRLLIPHVAQVLKRAGEHGADALPLALTVARQLRTHMVERDDHENLLALARLTVTVASRDTATSAASTTSTTESLTDKQVLGQVLLALGEYEECLTLQQEVLQARERTDGPDAPTTLSSAHHLYFPLYWVGDVRAAESTVRRAAEGRARTLGAEHPDTLLSKGLLAEVLCRLGEREENVRLAEEISETSTRVLGEEHPVTLTCLLTRAFVLDELGRPDEAEAPARSAFEGHRAAKGPDHWLTTASAHRLASVLRGRGQWEEAECLARQVLTTRLSSLGEAHAHTLLVQVELARITDGSGRRAEAVALARSTLSACLTHLGAEHPVTAECRSFLEKAESATRES